MYSLVMSPFSHDFIKTEIDCVQYSHGTWLYSLVMSPFLHDFIKTEIDCVQYSHGTWFLDGRTSILVPLFY